MRAVRVILSFVKLPEGLPYALRNTAFAIGFLAAANACGGGGCGGGCAGSGVIPGGFPKAERVTNAAGVRVTRKGLDFLEQQLGTVVAKALAGSAAGGVIKFEVPESSGSMAIAKYKLCYGGPKPGETPPKCVVEIDVSKISNVKIVSAAPHELQIAAKVPIRLQRLPIETRDLLGNTPAYASATVGAGSCDKVEFLGVPITAVVSLESVPDDPLHAARAGYTRIKIDPKKFSFDAPTIKSGFKFCGGSAMDGFLGLFSGLIADSIVGGLGDQLAGPLASATCMTAQKQPDGTELCPTGTFNRKGTCRFADDDAAECAPMLLGLESRFDLSGLLASLSPATTGGLDFLLAAGGDMSPAPSTGATTNGLTLGLLGGAMPQPLSNCVPHAENKPPTGIVLPDLLSANDVPDWKGAAPVHLGIGLSERYLNHAAAAAYDSGLLCVAITTEQIAQLNGGLFSLLAPSIKGLADGFDPSGRPPAMALSIRPQLAPNITVGENKADFTSPLLGVALKNTELDFFMWSHERFVRLFTGKVDIGVPVNLEGTKDGLAIRFAPKSPLAFTNASVSNNAVLLESDATLGKLVQSIGGLIPASTFSSIAPIKLDSALSPYGLKLTIPEGGVRKLDKGEERFVGVFAYLEPSGAAVPTTKTSARVVKTTIDPKNYELATVGDAPTAVAVHASAAEDDGSRAVEYAYKVDAGPWTSFFRERDFVVTSPFFMLQGKHTVQVSSRIVGVVDSEGEPVTLPVLIDVVAPQVHVRSAPGGAEVFATDYVSRGDELRVESRVDGGAWIPVARVGDKRFVTFSVEAKTLEVRATDEAGNVAQTSAPLIRGRADSTVAGGSGCGCAVPGARPSSAVAPGLLALTALGGLGLRLRRRRK